MKYIYIIVLFGIILSIGACEIKNPDEDIPAFIEINRFDFTAGPSQGTDSADIIDSWIYIDDNPVGAFEMPFIIPVLESGKHSVKIRPGIKLNGIAATRAINQFYTSYNQIIDFEAGKTITISPKCKYVDGLKFPWNSRGEEDFEEGGISIDSASGSSVRIKKTSSEVYEGTYSGHIELDVGHKTYFGQSKEFDLPKAGKPVVLEIHVKNPEVVLRLGLYIIIPGRVISAQHMGINVSDNWRKFYVNYTQLVSSYPNAIGYRVTFSADLGSKTNADIYLDNIKLIHL